VPRLILRWGLVHNLHLRRRLADESNLPAPAIAARASAPAARYYAHVIDADEAAARQALQALPQMVDRVDALLAEATLVTDPPNAAALQVLCSVRALDAFSDLHEPVATRPSATAARQLYPEYPESIPRFIPRDWIAGPMSHA
jgi:hypothetical protein